jgi:hypothetical protein
VGQGGPRGQHQARVTTAANASPWAYTRAHWTCDIKS